MLDGRDMSVAVLARRLSARQLVLLQEVSSTDLFVLHGQGQFIQQIGSELDIVFAGPEQLIQPQVWLHRAYRSSVSEISGAAFTDQLTALRDKIAKLVCGGF